MKLMEAILETEYIRKQREVAKDCEELLALVRENPRVPRKELCKKLDWSKEKLNNRIQYLQEKELLSIEKMWVIHCD